MNEERRKVNLKTQIIWALATLLQTIVLGWVYKVSADQDSLKQRSAAIETRVNDMKEDVKEIKTDVKRLLERK